MGERAREVYQGNDWLTYRWPVAQMFDTLDRLRALCHSASGVSMLMGGLPQLPSTAMPRYDMQDDEDFDLFVCILELCDDLSAELDAVLADLFSTLEKDIVHRWKGFEMRLHLNEMRNTALTEHQAEHQGFEPSANATDTVLALASRIRDLLRAIDH